MRVGSIPASWLGITGSWSAKSNLDLFEEVTRRSIDPKDLDRVREVWEELKTMRRNYRDAVEFMDLINRLDQFNDDEMVRAMKDGDPVPSNPLLQAKHDVMRNRVRSLCNRMISNAAKAEKGSA